VTMGAYSFAMVLATQSAQLIAFQLGSVLQPIFSHLNDSVQRQAHGLSRAVALIGAIAVPVSLVQCSLAGPVLEAIWGQRWAAAIPVLQVLSIAQAFMFPFFPATFMLRAQGRFRAVILLQIVQLVMSLAVFPLGVALGPLVIPPAMAWIGISVASDAAQAIGLAYASLAVWIVIGPWSLWLGNRASARRMTSVLHSLLPPWLAGVPVAIGAWCLVSWLLPLLELRWARLGLVGVVAVAASGGGVLISILLRASTRADAMLITRRLFGRFMLQRCERLT
jgi:O-antigen/teichoic acid export membrane protein